ncbi:MAG: BatD family protein [Candidatus Firestonebacteria bacterium]
MKYIKSKILVQYLFIFFATSIFTYNYVYAQNISISASIDKNILSMDEQLMLQVTVSGDASSLSQPNIPSTPGFAVYSSGRSQSISIVNGKISSSVVFNYILAPNAPGKYTIGAITLTHKNQTYKTDPINIEVTKSTNTSPSGKSSNQQAEKETAPQGKSGKELFITTSIDKKTCYVNEQIILSFKFYRCIRLSSNPQYVPPSLTGFWTEDLPPQQNYYATIDAKQYLVTEIKTALFPTSSGKFTIGPATLNCSVDNFSANDFFNDNFFKGFFSQGKTIALKSNPLTIEVLALPTDNKPSDFKGTVGNYKLTASADKTKLQTGQPVTLTVSVSGVGNIKTIAEPSLSELKGFRKYDTISSLNISKENYRVQGSKIFKTVLIPQVAGKLQIPSLKLSIFNPQEKSYKTLTSPPIIFDVTQGSKQDTVAMQAIPTTAPEGVKLIEKDIRHIKPSTVFKNNTKNLYSSTLFIFLQFIPILTLAIAFQYKKHTEKMSTDIKYARFKTASKLAKKYLESAKKLLQTNDIKEFHCKLSESIYTFIAGKLGISASGLTLKQIEEELKCKNASEELIKQVINLLEECDFARFAPSKLSKEGTKKNYETAIQIITQLEKIL